MPFFKYTARNTFGEKITGKVEAKDERMAAVELQSRKLTVINLHPYTKNVLSELNGILFGVKVGDIVNFTRQLATMITAGLPLATALSILVKQGKEQMTRIVASILQEIEGGSTFSDALQKHPKVFERIYIQLVAAGETGGVLDNVLERLATNMEKKKAFRGKVRGAMIYPVIVILAMVIVGFIMMIFVIPKLTAMYADFGAELPLMTRVLMGVSDIVATYWYIFVAAGVGGFVALKQWYKTDVGEHKIDAFMLKIPIFGVLIQKLALTEFARTLALLLGAGVSLLESLEIVTEGMDNVIYRDALAAVSKQVEKGIPLSESLSVYDEFPPILHQMINVGEETGKIDEVLMKLSAYFEQETDQAVKNLTAAMEPLIMIVLGVGVGAMVIAVIMPIYNLTSQF